MKHIRSTQHWTYCRSKVRTLPDEEVVRPAKIAGMTRKRREEELCPVCYRRWKNDPLRSH